MCPTHEGCAPTCSFRLYPRINFAIDDIPFSEQEDEESFNLTLITSLEAHVIPRLGGDRILDYLITHLAKVLQQGYSSSVNHWHQVTYHIQTPSPGASNGKADSETMMDSTAPVEEVSTETLFLLVSWCPLLHLLRHVDR